MEHVTMIRGRFSGRQIAIAYARPIKLNLGEFTGRRLAVSRVQRVALIAGAAVIAAYAALIYAAPTCRIVATTKAGDAYVLGEGDTLSEAMEAHGPLPADWREIAFPGCVR